MGRIDLHNHLLPALDDGATDVAEALAIARALVAAGYTDVATTPHAKPDLSPSPELAASRRAELQQLLDDEQLALRLHPGCENHVTPEFVARVEAGEPRPLGSGPYVLVELPFASPVPGFRELVFRLLLLGIRPLVAHPERCAQFTLRLEAAREVVDAGAFLQIEIGSLAGMYGGPAKKCVQALLAEDLVAVAATDVHHLKSGREILGPGLKVLEKALGPTRLQLLTEENPARVLTGAPLAGT